MKNETKNVKNYIKNNFHILAKISIEKLILFVNEFFKDEHENVINKLDSIPKVQLKYIENVIETYKENLDEIYYNYSMKREFSKMLLMLIKLLIKNKENYKIINLLKEYKNLYNNEEFLNICKENEISDCQIFLLNEMKFYDEAFDVCMNEIKKYYENIVNTIINNVLLNNNSNLNNNEINKIFIKFKSNIEICFEICIKSNKNKLWLNFYIEIENIINHFKDINTNKTEIESILNLYIKKMLEKILKFSFCYSGSYDIINYSLKNSENPNKIFIDKLCNIIPITSKFKNFLETSKIFFNNNNIKKNNELINIKNTGMKYKIKKCDFCNKIFNKLSNQTIIFFKCGHKFHRKCCINHKICTICYNNELDENVIENGSKNFYIKVNKGYNKDVLNEQLIKVKKNLNLRRLTMINENYNNEIDKLSQ